MKLRFLLAAVLGIVAAPAWGATGTPFPSAFGRATTSAQAIAGMSDETGTGALVFGTSPTLTTPNLGTPSAIVLTNGTGLPLAGVSGMGSGGATWLATPNAANFAAFQTGETGTGAPVLADSPTISSATLSGTTGAVNLEVSGDFIVSGWPASGVAGFTGTGELEAKSTGVDFAGIAPIVRKSVTGLAEAYYGTAASTAAEYGTALVAAQTAASSGDTIYVDQNSSTYLIATSLGKNGVNWRFAPGAIVETTTADLEVWDDAGAAKTFTVDGSGIFRTTSGNARVLVLTHASSVVSFRCSEIRSNGAAKAGIYLSSGATLTLTADLVSSDDYDSIWNDAGNLRAEVKTIVGGGDGIETSGTSGLTFVRALTITGNGNSAGGSSGYGLQLSMDPTSGQQVIEAQEIKSLLASPIAMRVDGTYAVVRAARIIGEINVATDADLHVQGGIQSGLAASQSSVRIGEDNFGPTTLNLYGVTLASGASATNSIKSQDIGDSTGKVVNFFGINSANKPVKTDDPVAVTYNYTRGVFIDTSGTAARTWDTDLDDLLDGTLTAARGGTGLNALSANVVSYMGAADYSAMRTLLGLVIGTNVQAFDSDLTTWAGVTPGSNIATALALAANATGAPWLQGHTSLVIDAAAANDGGTIGTAGSQFTLTADRQLVLGSGSGWDVILSPTNGNIQLNGLTRRKVTAGITASTTQTQGQGALTSEVNAIATCANVNDTVTLPSAASGMRVTIINNGAQTLRIFPASGDNAGAGVDTAVTLAAGSNVSYVAYNATDWEVD